MYHLQTFIVLVLISALAPVLALQLPQYETLRTVFRSGLLDVTVHNPKSPKVNLWTPSVTRDMKDLVDRLQYDNRTKVVIFKSDIPRFFIAHLDLSAPELSSPEAMPEFNTLIYNISTLPQVTIGAVEGRARGAGNELLVALDMRFATKKDTFFGQIEVGSGQIPAIGGQYLPRLIGRGLALEYILSSKDIDPSEAERIGWINKAFDTSEEMYSYIDELTSRLRLFPLSALRRAKQAVDLSVAPKLNDVLDNAQLFNQQRVEPEVLEIGRRLPLISGNRSELDIELYLPTLLLDIYA